MQDSEEQSHKIARSDLGSEQVGENEAIQQGIVYPPPPSFYQSMPPVLFSQPVQIPRGVELAQGGWQKPFSEGSILTTPPTLPTKVQAPITKSRRRIWIVVSSLSLTLLVITGLCAWLSYALFAGGITVADDYYSLIQSKNYMSAYHDLAPEGQIAGLTQGQFVQQAHNVDTRFGPVTSYALVQPSFRTDPDKGIDLSRLTMTVDVTRSKLSYTMLLSERKIGRTWKIIDFDRI